MLTFTTAPKTVLGPCTHALWNGVAIYSRHHRHMPQGEAAWKEQVARALSSPEAAAAADGVVRLMREGSDLGRRAKQMDSRDYMRDVSALHGAETTYRATIERLASDEDLPAIIDVGESVEMRRVKHALEGGVSPEVFDMAGWPTDIVGMVRAVVEASGRPDTTLTAIVKMGLKARLDGNVDVDRSVDRVLDAGDLLSKGQLDAYREVRFLPRGNTHESIVALSVMAAVEIVLSASSVAGG
jgi:hypothetical protein